MYLLNKTTGIKVTFLFLLLMGGTQMATAQEHSKTHPNAVAMLKFNGGAGVPGADMARRFGMNGLIGIGFYYKTKSNWLYGSEFDFLFGNKIKEDSLLQDISTPDGFLIGLDGHLYAPVLYERGFRWQIGISKILNRNKNNPNSGLIISAHTGILQHRILYDVKQRENLPQISKEMQKGYDRLSSGISFTEFVGYQHMSNNRMINYAIGIEFTQAFTKNQRALNFDTNTTENTTRKDFMYALKFSWFLPFYKSDYKIEYIID